MTSEKHDPLWRELATGAQRFALRLDPAYWRCPSCGLGATNIEPWGRAFWAWCELCQTFGPVGEDLLDPRPGCDQDGRPVLVDEMDDSEMTGEQFRYEWLRSLSGFHNLTSGDSMTKPIEPGVERANGVPES